MIVPEQPMPRTDLEATNRMPVLPWENTTSGYWPGRAGGFVPSPGRPELPPEKKNSYEVRSGSSVVAGYQISTASKRPARSESVTRIVRRPMGYSCVFFQR